MSRRIDPRVAIRDGAALDRAMVRVHRQVILYHRMLGVPLVMWRDGKVVEVDPETVELPEVPELPDSSEDRSDAD